jgi:TFIIF-interacting CTD phosphatase-like protein
MSIVEIHSRRDLTKTNGKYFKDLTKIKGDLSQIIMIDNAVDSVLQRENVIPISSFNGLNMDDSELKKIAEHIKQSFSSSESISDLRTLVEKYKAK